MPMWEQSLLNPNCATLHHRFQERGVVILRRNSSYLDARSSQIHFTHASGGRIAGIRLWIGAINPFAPR
jgi:hypothetical protein